MMKCINSAAGEFSKFDSFFSSQRQVFRVPTPSKNKKIAYTWEISADGARDA